MSWLQRLIETYESCFGLPQFEQAPLAPIDHVEQQAHIEIALDESGIFLRAMVVNKEPTLIPASEKSAGRTSSPVAHPLCDKLRYVACDYGSPDHALYLDALRSWTKSDTNPKLEAVLAYVERGEIVKDLVDARVLTLDVEGKLETKWNDGASALAKLLSVDPTTKERDQGDALIRWRVEIPGEQETAVWKDLTLQASWSSFYELQPSLRGVCFASGELKPLTSNHPKFLRRPGDQAKLISTNDSPFDHKGKPKQHGYTFAGRFTSTAEAYGLSSSATQKAHNALRWLISRQGSKNSTQVVVAWAVRGAEAAPVIADTLSFLDALKEHERAETDFPPTDSYLGDAGQEYARRLAKAVHGYQARISDHGQIVVMALDSATPGRLAIQFYRELTGSEFLDRLERWHRELAWSQNFGKERHFIGAPAPRDIAEAAYGRRVDDKLRKATIERLLPCILDGRPLPRDLMLATAARATNRVAMESWEFERVLGIACSLVRAVYPKEFPTMALDEGRHTRDYLYGRLLAVADSIEEMALSVGGENRETNAARLMQRFADHPSTTWRTIELQLRPYIARLRSSRFGGALVIRQRLLDTLPGQFPLLADGTSSFIENRKLAAEFLLGYHSQRSVLAAKKAPVTGTSTTVKSEGDL